MKENYQIVCVELVVNNGFLGLPLALGELEVEGDDGDRGGDHLEDHRGDHVSQGEDPQHKEVGRQQHVDVFFAEDLNIKSIRTKSLKT